MRILHITTNWSGGAGIACRRLWAAQVHAGLDAHVLCLQVPALVKSERVHSFFELRQNKLGKLLAGLELRANQFCNKLPTIQHPEFFINGPRSLYHLESCTPFQQADIVHLHWVPKLLDFRSVFAQKQKAFVWTLHDMQPFTGGNHYQTDSGLDVYANMLHRNRAYKHRELKGSRLSVVSPSVWLAQEARKSEVMSEFRVEVIPNLIPTDVFRPMDKTLSRQKLGLPHGQRLLLFVAEKVSDKRKGFDLLLEALADLPKDQDFGLIVLGNWDTSHEIKMPLYQMGYQEDPEMLASIYSAADVFVLPSREDNLPNTMVESLACGTPVVGFRIGGLPDLVKDGVTGWCVEPYLPKALAKGILEVCQKPGTYQNNCRQTAIAEVAPEPVLEKYLRVYENLLV
jgi:glycosyltransferase involved in cell wall biosynthesis